MVMNTLLVVKGNQLYQAACGARVSHDMPGNVSHFFDSFALLAK
jgi:hypothetical protein